MKKTTPDETWKIFMSGSLVPGSDQLLEDKINDILKTLDYEEEQRKPNVS